MKERVAQLAERFEAFSLRERGLIALTIVVVLFMFWDSVVLNPQESKQKKIVNEMYSLNQQMEAVSQNINSISTKISGRELEAVQKRSEEIRNLLTTLERQQKDLTVQFIRPQHMAKVLEDMLTREGGLKLIRLESLGAEPLFPPDEEQEATSDVQKPGIFKHGMRVVFEGDFNSTLNYLHALESMTWSLYWDNVDYQVIKYPRAKIIITVHTLSLDESWIGV